LGPKLNIKFQYLPCVREIGQSVNCGNRKKSIYKHIYIYILGIGPTSVVKWAWKAGSSSYLHFKLLANI